MSLRVGAPYADRVEAGGKILIYEGHDAVLFRGGPDPKKLDQPKVNPGGALTQNGLFYKAAKEYQRHKGKPEAVKVYEKIKSGIWVYNGVFRLLDAWQELAGERKVFKFKLELSEQSSLIPQLVLRDPEHNRMIPSTVKLAVWKRDGGKCRLCERQDHLHFDHIIPFSQGGASLVAENIQLLCARHNLKKRDKIE